MISRTTVFLLSLLASTPASLRSQQTPLAPIRVSGGVMAGTILHRVKPAFPQDAHVSGATFLHAIIGRDGHVKSLSVISGPELLRAPVIDAVQQWTYKPYLLNGEPVEVETTITNYVGFGGPPSQAPVAPSQASVRISGGVLAGYILTKVWPTLPLEARENHVNGAVVLHAIIGKDGHIKSLVAISGPEMLRAAYMDAVCQWIYRPHLLNGEPVEVDTTLTLSMQYGGDH